MIVSFASSKGGVGKSTICAAIGARLAQRGEDVLILDLDQTRTVERWGRKANIKGLTVKAIERDSFTTVIREAALGQTIDHILIDLAVAREATVLKAIARSDLVVIPAQASEPDLREALVVISDIKDVAEEKGGSIPYRLLLTKMPPLRTRVTDFAYQELARYGLPVFRTVMIERVAYKEMFLTGSPPEATGAAGLEVAAITSEMEDIIKSAQGHRAPREAVGQGGTMTAVKPLRPPFQAIVLDPIDARLEARAAEKGVQTLVSPKTEVPEPLKTPPQEASPPPKLGNGSLDGATPRSRMKGLKIELPDYAWIELKKRSAEEMVSARYFIMETLRAKGIPIHDVDMIEDGRRFQN
jgi:chromosome partitioning protein